jgi:hypothetical protein
MGVQDGAGAAGFDDFKMQPGLGGGPSGRSTDDPAVPVYLQEVPNR